jgi:hypothetical protein
MKTDDFLSLLEFKNHKGQVLIPAQYESQEFLELLKDNETVFFKQVKPRDIGMHQAYFLILNYIYDRLNENFRKKVCAKKDFYMFLKFISNDYKVKFKFKDGREFIEYNSISFAKMNQVKFREYFNNQLITIYEELLIPLEQDYLMDEINIEFEKILSKLI